MTSQQARVTDNRQKVFDDLRSVGDFLGRQWTGRFTDLGILVDAKQGNLIVELGSIGVPDDAPAPILELARLARIVVRCGEEPHDYAQLDEHLSVAFRKFATGKSKETEPDEEVTVPNTRVDDFRNFCKKLREL